MIINKIANDWEKIRAGLTPWQLSYLTPKFIDIWAKATLFCILGQKLFYKQVHLNYTSLVKRKKGLKTLSQQLANSGQGLTPKFPIYANSIEDIQDFHRTFLYDIETISKLKEKAFNDVIEVKSMYIVDNEVLKLYFKLE